MTTQERFEKWLHESEDGKSAIMDCAVPHCRAAWQAAWNAAMETRWRGGYINFPELNWWPLHVSVSDPLPALQEEATSVPNARSDRTDIR